MEIFKGTQNHSAFRQTGNQFLDPVWSTHASCLEVSKKNKYFNADELIEGTDSPSSSRKLVWNSLSQMVRGNGLIVLAGRHSDRG
jgi:hypothetical protein